MKKYFFLLTGLFFLTINLIAQEVKPPTDIADAVSNLNVYLASLAGIAVLSTFLTGFFNGVFVNISSLVRRLVSWLVPVVITLVLGNLLNIGFLAELPWYTAVLYGIGAGLISNGIFTIQFVQEMIFFIEGLFGNKK
jgi:hypothetical protein